MPEPPTVAVDVRALLGNPTGIGVYTTALLLAMARRGAVRPLAVAHRLPAEAQRLELQEAGVRFAAQAAPSGVVWQQLVLPGWLRRRPDVELFWSPLQTLPPAPPVPAVTTVHDLTVLLLPHTHSFKVRWSQRPFLGPSLRRAARVVAISAATAADVARLFPECAGRLQVIHNGVDSCFSPASAAEVRATRERHGLPDGYLLYAGTQEPRKNIGLLVDAWEEMRRAGEAPPLVLAGGYGWRSRALVRRLEGLASLGLRMTGSLPRDELVRIVQAASIFVYPSLYEGFGLPALEAMACGVPTVVSDRGSLPEVVGDAAAIVGADDRTALVTALRSLLTDGERREELGRRGRERAATFTWERAAAALEALFLDLAAGR